MKISRRVWLAGLVLAAYFAPLEPPCTAADPPPHDPLAQAKATLGPWQPYVGRWRGVGQPQRGSSRGAWSERSAWKWNFADGDAAIMFTVEGGKHYTAGRIVAGAKHDTFDLQLTRTDATIDRFVGSLADHGQATFNAAEPETAVAARITFRQVAEGDRMLMLLERRTGDAFNRLAEIGYTREGSDFAKGAAQPECVVTGGAGTIAVEFEGKTYYVCCSGCRDLFNEKPAAILAEYQKRRQQP
ncbi:MAG TPA: hypothetical protein VG713_16030 [Pirellulales bacterium]|nr:hypothetical protein [Pirellulales bacterium]